MPEGLEAEIWRRAATPLVGRVIVGGWADDRSSPAGLVEEVVGARISGVRRLGKIVLIDVRPRAARRGSRSEVRTIGLHFGMTGRLVIDGAAPIERLAYASGRDDPAWDRLILRTSPTDHRGGGAVGGDGSDPALRLNDPRRLGHVSLDADLSHLGVDLFAVTAAALTEAFANRRVALKVALLNQDVVAGLGNLLADEVLWWAGLSPHRSVDSLDPTEIGRLASTIRRRLPIMLRRGGSTTGTLSPDVRAGCPPCPRDAGSLRREEIGQRTAVWCPAHQH